jgi:hypothetical protein
VAQGSGTRAHHRAWASNFLVPLGERKPDVLLEPGTLQGPGEATDIRDVEILDSTGISHRD